MMITPAGSTEMVLHRECVTIVDGTRRVVAEEQRFERGDERRDVDGVRVVEVVRGDVVVFLGGQAAVVGVLRDEHDALLLEVVHDEIADGGLAAGGAAGDADEEGFLAAAATLHTLVERGRELAEAVGAAARRPLPTLQLRSSIRAKKASRSPKSAEGDPGGGVEAPKDFVGDIPTDEKRLGDVIWKEDTSTARRGVSSGGGRSPSGRERSHSQRIVFL